MLIQAVVGPGGVLLRTLLIADAGLARWMFVGGSGCGEAFFGAIFWFLRPHPTSNFLMKFLRIMKVLDNSAQLCYISKIYGSVMIVQASVPRCPASRVCHI